MSLLFSPITIGAVTFKNRIVTSPMCQYSAVDGFANNWHLVHLGSRAVGGVGSIITEAAAVSPEGRISPDDLGIYKDEHIDKLKEIVDFLKEHGTVAGIQLAHAGRKASSYPEWKGSGKVPLSEGGWQTIAPSSIAFANNYDTPLPMDLNDIERVKNDFVKGAQRAVSAGFQILEIHAAHGYLFHQFLSPLSNHRTDNYGGSFENRIRFLMETLNAIKSAVPEHILIYVRISATDWAEEGVSWDLEQSIQLSKLLSASGVDLIDVSTGGTLPNAKIPIGASYQLPFAAAIKRALPDQLVGTVGMITNPEQAETILLQKDADFIIMARELLRNPYWAYGAAAALHDKTFEWPNQYRRANPNFNRKK